MHRSYSMRNPRAATGSQLTNPVPQSNLRKGGKKMNLSKTFRTQSVAMFTPEMAKRLAALVKMEKGLLRSQEVVALERKDCARQLSYWGEDCDDDISDVSDKLGVLLYEIGELEETLIDRYDQYRLSLKNIRDIEASHREPDSPKLITLEQELVREEAACLVAEAQLTNITRENFKFAFNLQFDALREHAEKVAMITGYAKNLLDLIDDDPITPGEMRPAYDGYATSKQIILDAEKALASWTSDSTSMHAMIDVDGLPIEPRVPVGYTTMDTTRFDSSAAVPTIQTTNYTSNETTRPRFEETNNAMDTELPRSAYVSHVDPEQHGQVVQTYDIGEEDDMEAESVADNGYSQNTHTRIESENPSMMAAAA
ncbi:protein kinase inhibitor [Schizosaccharomyces japonicus yFS275]|uniref:Protein kinase inhibitor n=1 Tax=Schizosaccharomyces japonicus (strain yFS275 / FY16936) TaxID=402676 RepID=B6K0Y9_SCHJY|nr:protein kinase inhibitor [Schizosaccharomyces japonicus yFS275]EEB07610.1 protein kinase inhibitor [Schizosaccharomyces japonicus yFS275]